MGEIESNLLEGFSEVDVLNDFKIFDPTFNESLK